jgi:hypothetical protein
MKERLLLRIHRSAGRHQQRWNQRKKRVLFHPTELADGAIILLTFIFSTDSVQM